MASKKLRQTEGYKAQAREYQKKKYAKDPDAARAYAREWAAKNKEKIRARRMRRYYANRDEALAKQREFKLRFAYGLTIAEYDVLLAKQGGACAICAGLSTDGKKLAVDHCHDTGKVRGLLCNMCNRAVGCFRDNPDVVERAARYLREASS